MFSPFHFMDLSFVYFMVIFLFFMGTSNWLLHFKFTKTMIKVIILFFMCLNLVSLNPYSWSLTGYMWGNLLLALSVCFSLVIYSMLSKFNIFMSHLLPLGSPIFLWNIMVLLELTSILIRPLTLSLRLTCNMLAGHVLLSLTANLSLLGGLLLFFLLLFESAVAYIQSYVFGLLTFIYFSEHK